ncbi:MAG: hypothetical protein MUC63_02495, partial [Planctomycetes bacterium]|nr:hypothetical protein [Planctomycetota bacterium]
GRTYLVEWEEVARECRRIGELFRGEGPGDEGWAFLDETVAGGHLLAVSVPRALCRAPRPGGEPCRGRPQAAPGGGQVCPACGRVFPSAEETCLVVAGPRHVFCVGLNPPVPTGEKTGEGK